jgi:hypothetical protein
MCDLWPVAGLTGCELRARVGGPQATLAELHYRGKVSSICCRSRGPRRPVLASTDDRTLRRQALGGSLSYAAWFIASAGFSTVQR